MSQDPNNTAATARSGQATGYATEMDAAMGYFIALDGPRCYAYADTFGTALAREVIRLRAALESIRDFGAPVCPYPTEEQKDLNEIYEITLKAIGPWVAGQAHNKPELNDSAKTN